MALNPGEIEQLKQLADGRVGILVAFQGDRLAAAAYTVDAVLQAIAPHVDMAPPPEPPPAPPKPKKSKPN